MTAIIASIVGGCLYFGGEKTFEFKEEVKLASGRTINVARLLKAKPLGELGGPGGWEIAFASLQVLDTVTGPAPPTWASEDGLVPLLLDREENTGEWFLVTTFHMCDAWYTLGRPKLPYAEFRVADGGWRRVALSPGLIGRRGNVYAGIPPMPGDMDLSAKMHAQIDPMIAPKYLRIVDQWRTGC